MFVFGTTAKFVVTPVFILVSKNANASENWHWKLPYSSEAKTKSKLKCDEIGVKSNSSTVAFTELIVMPAAAKVACKVASPVQADEPSLSIEVFGPTAFSALPVLRITPDCIGKPGLVFVKYPIPLDELKLVPVRHVTFVASTQGELIRMLFTS